MCPRNLATALVLLAAAARPGPEALGQGESSREESRRASQLRVLRLDIERGGPTALLSRPAVRDGLGLAPERLRARGPRPVAEGRPRAATAATTLRGKRASPDPAAAVPLPAEQGRRLSEIALQVEGPLALARSPLRDRLNLTPEQRLRVQELRNAADTAWRRVADERSGRLAQFVKERENRADHREINAFLARIAPELDGPVLRAEAQRREAAEAALRLLTRRQRAAYQKLLGEPFPIESLLPPPAKPAGEQEPVILEPVSRP